jgi:hypothetical protein
MGTRGLSFLFAAGVGKERHHAVMRPAEARRTVSIMMSSSIQL